MSDHAGGERSITANRPLAGIIAAGLAVRVALTPLYAHLPNGLFDEGFWKHWMERVHQHGVLNIFRTSDTDYVGYHWVLWLLSLIYEWIGGPYTQTTPSLHILVKMPSILFDVVLILAVYAAAKMLAEELGHSGRARRLALIAAGVIAFHPAVLYDSAVWAQTDSAITAAMLGAILLAWRARPALSGAAMGLGMAVKPHPVIVGPIVALLLWRSAGLRALALAVCGFAVIAALVLGPWVLHGDGGRIAEVYQTLLTKDHNRLSELAWNLWWMPDYAGDPRPGTAVFPFLDWLTYRQLAFALSGAASLLALAYAWRRPSLEGALIAAAYQAFAFYALPVASHERYMYPLLALLLPVALLRRGWLWLYVPLSLTFFLNLIVVAPPVDSWSDRWVYGWFGAYVAGVNMTLFTAYTVVLVVDIARGARARRLLPTSAMTAQEGETVGRVAQRL